jgi:hypothetical protein
VAADTSGSGGTDWTTLLGSLGNIYGGIQANSGASAVSSQINNAYSFNNSRPAYTAQLNALEANPSLVTQTPGYQYGMDSALQAAQRTGASQGLTGSGLEEATLQQTGLQYENQAFQQEQSTLMQLSGANLDPANYITAMQSNNQTKANGSGSVLSGAGGLLSSLFGGASSTIGDLFGSLFGG